MNTERYQANVEKLYDGGHSLDYAHDWAYGYELSVALGKTSDWIDTYAAAAFEVRRDNGDMGTAIALADSWIN